MHFDWLDKMRRLCFWVPEVILLNRKVRKWSSATTNPLKARKWKHCPQAINRGTKHMKDAFKDAGLRVPDAFESSCCAEFGLSRERIRQHPIKVYRTLQDGLLNGGGADTVHV